MLTGITEFLSEVTLELCVNDEKKTVREIWKSRILAGRKKARLVPSQGKGRWGHLTGVCRNLGLILSVGGKHLAGVRSNKI